MPTRSSPLLVLSFVAVTGWSSGADEYRAKALEEAPPEEVAEKIRAELPEKGIRIEEKDGDPFVDVWLREEVPTQEPLRSLGVDFGQVPEGSLLGVVRFHKRGKDFRGNKIPPGVYTFRTAIQPQDGDHLGVSETRDFVLLVPAKADTEPGAVAHDKLVELSVQVTGTKHPTVLYLVKMFGKAEDLPRVVEDGPREFWILDCRIPEKGKPQKAVRLGLVVVGRAAETF